MAWLLPQQQQLLPQVPTGNENPYVRPLMTDQMQMQLQMLQGGGISKEEKQRLQQAQMEYDAAVKTALGEQRLNLADMRSGMEEYKAQPRDINLAPVAMMADMLNRGQTNLTGQYRMSGMAPESEAQRTQNVRQMQKDITVAQNQLSQQNIQALKSNLGAMKQGMTASAQARILESGLRERNKVINRNEKRLEKFETFSDKVTKDFTEEAKGFAMLRAGMAPDPKTGEPDFQKVMSSLGNYSRSIAGEKGVLTDQDIERILPKTFVGGVAKFKAMMTGDAPTAGLPEGFTDVLVEMIELAQKKTYDQFNDRIGTYKKQNKTLWGQYKNLQPIFDEGFANIDSALRKSFGVAPEITETDIDKMSKEELEAFLKGQ